MGMFLEPFWSEIMYNGFKECTVHPTQIGEYPPPPLAFGAPINELACIAGKSQVAFQDVNYNSISGSKIRLRYFLKSRKRCVTTQIATAYSTLVSREASRDARQQTNSGFCMHLFAK